MTAHRIKLVITGAAGQIGYALLFRIASGQMFGPHTKIDLTMLELEHSLPACEGLVMELEDCAFPLLSTVSFTSDINQAMTGAEWVLLVGAVPRQAGMERADLLEINGKIFKTQAKAINDFASDDVRVLVVGNPCNTNAYIAMKNAPDVPKDHFFAMTMLDELRAKAQLAKKAHVEVPAVTNMIIWGNHSATQYPDFYHALIKHKSALEAIKDEKWLQNDFVSTVQNRGAAVIKARGSSSAASAANAIIESVKAIVTDTPSNHAYSMCVCSHGQYGVDSDLIFSFPCRTKNGKVTIIDNISHSAYGQEKLKITLEELRKERDTVNILGLT